MTFECERCGYETEVLTNLKKHFQKKTICPATLNDVTIEQMLTNLIKDDIDERIYQCDFCEKSFKFRQNKYSHHKICKQRPDDEQDLINLRKEVVQLKDEIEAKNEQNKIKEEEYLSHIKKLEEELAFYKNKKDEKFYQPYMEKYLNGKHMKLKSGITDVSNDILHAELKEFSSYKNALGQLQAYNLECPRENLHVYPFPGRAEPTRLLLTIGGIPFEDVHVSFEEWPKMKQNTPFGGLPLLEVNGKVLAQSLALEYYAAKLAGMLPTDPLACARVYEVVAFVREIMDPFDATSSISDSSTRIKARKDISKSKMLENKLNILNTMCATKQYLAGSRKPTLADVFVFNFLSMITSGILEGVPTMLLSKYHNLKAFHKKFAAIPKVAAKYIDGPATYKALP